MKIALMMRNQLIPIVWTWAMGQILLTTWGAQAQSYKGKTLKVLSFKESHAEAVKKNLSEFEHKTGANVQFDMIDAPSVSTKIATDQMGGGTYDVYAVDEPFMPQLQVSFLPVSQWPATQDFVLPKPAKDLFVSASLQGASFNGELYGLPINGNVYMYVYRKDLMEDPKEKEAYLKRFGTELKVPKSLAEMKQVAAFFHRPPHLFGFAPFTKKSEGTTVEALWILASHGVNLKSFDVSSAAQALQTYQDLMSFAPPGAKNWHHAERMASYAKGKLAQMMTWPSFVKDLEKAEKSLVAGKNGYALPPASIAGKGVGVAGTWSLSIPKSTKQGNLAAEFATWWASSPQGFQWVEQGMNPARKDLLESPQLASKNPWFPVLLQTFQSSVVRPRSVKYKEISEGISREFTLVIAGNKTAQEAAQSMATELKKNGF